MICTSCNIDKDPLRFGFYPNKEIRYNICKECSNQKRRELYLEEVAVGKKEKIQTMKALLSEIIESCECRNSRRLKICIEKAKVEVGGQYTRRVGGN